MYKEFGAQLRKWREETGLSLRRTAQRAGIAFASLSEYELGKALPPLERRRELAAVLGKSMKDIEDALSECQIREYLRARPDLSPRARDHIESFVRWALEEDRKAQGTSS